MLLKRIQPLLEKTIPVEQDSFKLKVRAFNLNNREATRSLQLKVNNDDTTNDDCPRYLGV